VGWPLPWPLSPFRSELISCPLAAFLVVLCLCLILYFRAMKSDEKRRKMKEERDKKRESRLVYTPHKQRGITRIDFGSDLV
jgi:hypothetical protein